MNKKEINKKLNDLVMKDFLKNPFMKKEYSENHNEKQLSLMENRLLSIQKIKKPLFLYHIYSISCIATHMVYLGGMLLTSVGILAFLKDNLDFLGYTLLYTQITSYLAFIGLSITSEVKLGKKLKYTTVYFNSYLKGMYKYFKSKKNQKYLADIDKNYKLDVLMYAEEKTEEELEILKEAQENFPEFYTLCKKNTPNFKEIFPEVVALTEKIKKLGESNLGRKSKIYSKYMEFLLRLKLYSHNDLVSSIVKYMYENENELYNKTALNYRSSHHSNRVTEYFRDEYDLYLDSPYAIDVKLSSIGKSGRSLNTVFKTLAYHESEALVDVYRKHETTLTILNAVLDKYITIYTSEGKMYHLISDLDNSSVVNELIDFLDLFLEDVNVITDVAKTKQKLLYKSNIELTELKLTKDLNILKLDDLATLVKNQNDISKSSKEETEVTKKSLNLLNR